MRSFQVLILALFLIACGGSSGGGNRVGTQTQDVNAEFVLDRSGVIWGFDFLPDNQVIFTVRSGQMHILNLNTLDTTRVRGLPSIRSNGEGGLLDLKLHPDFENNNLVYFCYTPSNGRAIALSRARLNGSNLENEERIFITQDTNSASIHFGCRLLFQDSDHLYLTIGDQAQPSEAQSLDSHLGKILRLRSDGSIPSDNPFASATDALPEVWSLGHRNPQGLAIRPGTNELYSSEHGPTGGDELNVIRPGENYGWPLVTKGEPAGELGQSAPGFVDPITFWTPAIAPAGITFFRDQLYIATLRGRHIRRLSISGNEVVTQESFNQEGNPRIRHVSVSPDGLLYFSTDDGRIGRINF